ncbi:MAG: hypothetical protein WCO52_05050 [bacterium]
MGLVNLAKAYLTNQIEDSIKEAISPLAPYLRRLAFGTVIVLLATPALVLCLLALVGAVFLAFAGLPYVAASLWTALVCFGAGIVLALIGAMLLKSPRR